jgi:hypothetical protein
MLADIVRLSGGRQLTVLTPARALLIGSILFTLSFFQYDKLSIFLLYRYKNGILHKTKHP